MPSHPRLIKRGNVYWFRSSIPRDIKQSYPKTEEIFSLNTRDYQWSCPQKTGHAQV
ncbi:DUF6538 domain-containing protein [Sinorhizobium meliloti]|nr:DUF6538 domain-containing protein [Sinorhizobium meliloti]